MTLSMQAVLDYFELQRRPFSPITDPAFLFPAPQHRRARTMLDYALMSDAPFAMITGDAGVGKTLVLREMLSSPNDAIRFGLVTNATAGTEMDLLRLVLIALGEPPAPTESYAALYAQIEALLIDVYRTSQRVVLVLDEADRYAPEILDHLGHLTNINYGEHCLFQVILMGQTPIRERIGRTKHEGLAQRITTHAHISALTAAETEAYIAHRLEFAGAQDPIFAHDTFAQIFDAASGVPRLINQLCDFGMLYAYGEEARTVTSDHITAVTEASFLMAVDPPKPLRAVQ